MCEFHPGALLFHVKQASGSRHDLCTKGSMVIYMMNYLYYAELLDDMLKRLPQGNTTIKEASVPQQRLFVALTSQEMIALSLLLSILHI